MSTTQASNSPLSRPTSSASAERPIGLPGHPQNIRSDFVILTAIEGFNLILHWSNLQFLAFVQEVVEPLSLLLSVGDDTYIDGLLAT